MDKLTNPNCPLTSSPNVPRRSPSSSLAPLRTRPPGTDLGSQVQVIFLPHDEVRGRENPYRHLSQTQTVWCQIGDAPISQSPIFPEALA